MTWLDSLGFERRPLVFVEDHLYHTGEALAALAERRPDLLGHVTVCAIDRPGPDTDAAVGEWLGRYPGSQIAAATVVHPRVRTISASDLGSVAAFAKLVASLIRPGGVLVQDVQLTTLSFVPADRWWESIYAAATVRGLFADRPPIVRFLSNKRGYEATFGRDLATAGFDPRDVIDKAELAAAGVPAIVGLIDRAFPLTLDAISLDGTRRDWRAGDADRAEVAAALDVLLWPAAEGVHLCGRAIAAAEGLLLREGPEAATWEALVADRLGTGDGVTVVDVGRRVAPAGAGRAEITNAAARHLHTLRGRLADARAIVTANHAYRFADGLRVGRGRAAAGSRAAPATNLR